MTDKPRKAPKRLFKNRNRAPTAEQANGLPSWMSPPRTDQERGIVAVHIRLPGREAEQAKMREVFAIHRVVDPGRERILQVATQLFLAERAHEPKYPNGVTVPSELRSEMPHLEGQRFLKIKASRTVPWFAAFDQRMCQIAMDECTYGVRSSSDIIPGVAVLALDDDRIVGYACACFSPRNMLLVSSEPGIINPARVMMMPESSTLKVPYVCIAWTAANYRRTGIALSLMEGIARRFRCGPGRSCLRGPIHGRGASFGPAVHRLEIHGDRCPHADDRCAH